VSSSSRRPSALRSSGGYTAIKNDLLQGEPRDFDPVGGLDTAELFAFLGATQIEAWNKLVKHYGGDSDVAQGAFADRVASQLDTRGVVDVLRHGVVDLGVTLRLAYFRPAHGLTPELVARYEANRLTATRQLRYEAGSNKSLDLALFVNGVPVATAELKNPLTGQGVDQAIGQYRSNRDPKNRTLSRAVVHFAVDPQRVAMTTRLAGSDTPVPAVQPGPRSRCGPGRRQPDQPDQPVRPCHRLPVGAGVGAQRLARSAGPLRACRQGVEGLKEAG
jgi:type I restriction enzyme R subunit